MVQNIQQYIRTFVDTASTHLAPFITQGKFNNEFIRGNQNKRVDPNSLEIVDKKDAQGLYLERKTFNRMLPIYLYRYGLLTQNMPIPGVKSITNTSEEVAQGTKINDFILAFIADNTFKKAYQRAIKHADVYGIEWFKTGIDWSEGNEICDIETTVNGEKGSMKLYEGKPFVLPIPIHEVFVDTLRVESMEDVNELVHRRAFSIDIIKSRYGYSAKEESVMDARLNNYPRYSNLGFVHAGEAKYAYVYEYYLRPNSLYPKGRYVILCNQEILYDNILPYKNAESGKRIIPFDFFNLQSIPHHMVGVTVYSQLIPIQETFNAAKNRYLEYVNHIAIGQMFYWENSLINKNGLTTKPGQMIGLKRNAKKPESVVKDKLSMEFINYIRALEDDLLVTAGLSQMAAYGSTKSNVRTDGVVDKLTESDENKLVNALDNISECMISVFKKLVYLEQERQEILENRLKIALVDNYTMQYKMAGVSAEKITIVNRDFLMQSDQALDKKLQQIIGMGLYNQAIKMSYVSKLEILNALRANFLTETLDPQERATHDLIVRENRLLLESPTATPMPEKYHVHAQHIVEHTLFRISSEVLDLQTKDPARYKALQQAIDMHVEAHEKAQTKSYQSNQVYGNAKASEGTPQGSKRPEWQGSTRTA